MFVFMFFLFGVAKAQASEAQFSDNNSTLFVKVFKDEDGYGSFLAHNHAVQAVGWSSHFKAEDKTCEFIKSKLSLLPYRLQNIGQIHCKLYFSA